jgi:hypothetical protein
MGEDGFERKSLGDLPRIGNMNASKHEGNGDDDDKSMAERGEGEKLMNTTMKPISYGGRTTLMIGVNMFLT